MTKYELPLGDEMNPNESGFSVILYKKLIRNWHEKATTEDYFSKFVFEYLAFSAIIRKYVNATSKGDRDAIELLKSDEDIKQSYLLKINPEEDRTKLIEYLKENPVVNGKKKVYIRDNKDWLNMIELIYSVRNNMFHGCKDPEDKRDQFLVEHAYKLLRPLVEILLHSKGMGGEIDED